MIKHFPSLNEVYNMVLQEESQRSLFIQSQPLIEASAMALIYDSKKKRNMYLVCNHCGKRGHLKDKCFRLIDFPEDFKFTKSKGNFKKGGNVSVNSATVDKENGHFDDVDVSSAVQLSHIQGQIQKLMALVTERGGIEMNQDSPLSTNQQNKPSLVNSALAGPSYLDNDWSC
ncbi:Uncharacterized protein TCM_045203 isoform 2 [Theobroma cacao]|uniref:Uncharacterized protein isoform 2 n=1 Tax=Theobroma cacao TaxID=3641 RepID=A0A061FYG3_THECC|nr:Uncharacterized protein TCM_045203 isoform 2 [Theobroma cacao]